MSTNGYVLNADTISDEEEVQNNSHLQDNGTSNSRPIGSALRENQGYSVGVQHTSLSNTVEKAAKMLEMLVKTKQQILLSGSSTDVTHGVHAADVEVVPAPDTHTQGSSKVKIKNIVDYSWEQKYYNGNVIAVHENGRYTAYCIKNVGKNTGYVRVINRGTDKRCLIKDLHGEIKDLAFAHSTSPMILAVIDEIGTLFIHEISESETEKEIKYTLLLKLRQDKQEICKYRRVSWCHFLPDDPQMPSENYSKLLVATHDNIAEMINLDDVMKEAETETTVSKLKNGYQKIESITEPISVAIYAPDGSALAVASLNGQVKFFQVYLQENSVEPRCLHQWEPHDGKPVTFLSFLDNHKDNKPDQSYWKFSITGSDENREFKIWCCVEWCCLQVIRFEAPGENTLQPCLKPCLDSTAEYLLLSDINRRVLYVLQFHQEPDISKACVVSLSQFPLIQPMLSFAILNAGVSRLKKSFDPSDNLDIEDEGEVAKVYDDDEDEGEEAMAACEQPSEEQTMIRLAYVQPKSLQECKIVFPTPCFLPEKRDSRLNITAISHESIASFKDGLSDLSTEPTHDPSCAEDDPPTAITATPSRPQIPQKTEVLLTPESFTTPSVNNEALSSGSAPLAAASTKSDESIERAEVGSLVEIDDQEPLATSEKIANHDGANNTAVAQRAHHSSSSSPSREVAEILSCESDDKVNDYEEPAINNEQNVHNTSNTSNGTITNSYYKSPNWPAAPSIDKIAQHTSPRESQSKVAQLSKQNEQLIEQLTANQKLTEDFIKDFKKRDKTLQSNIQAMLNVLNDQQQELKQQRDTISMLHSQIQHKSASDGNVKAQIETMFVHHENRVKNIIETCMISQSQENKQANQQILASISQILVNAIESKLAKLFKSEMKNSVVPVVSKLFEPVMEQWQLEVAHRMAALENNLKENIAMIVKSKATTDTIGSCVGTAVHSQISQAYQETFHTVIMPLFERASQTMFNQMNDNFAKGTTEYLHQVEKYITKKREEFELQSNLSKDASMQGVQDQVKTVASSVDKLHRKLADIQKIMSNQQEALCNSVMSAVRTGAVTPVPGASVSGMDPYVQQQHIQMLIKEDQINAAFQQVLSASDLQLVIYVCQNVDVDDVFSRQPCPLDQPVILSLIQQLSTDLTSDTLLKYRYLEEALMNIDPKHTITRDHLPAILNGLQQKLELYIKTSNDMEMKRKMRMLLMATKSL